VAVVDDDDAVRYSLRFLIELIGHEVEVFASAAEFLRAELQSVACVILDHHMPGMTGLQLVEHLRGAGVPIPIMLVTSAPSPAISARAAELGISEVLLKPPTESCAGAGLRTFDQCGAFLAGSRLACVAPASVPSVDDYTRTDLAPGWPASIAVGHIEKPVAARLLEMIR
jgi:CheY-like chemotaxis protein